MNADYVLDILLRLSGTRYDPTVVRALAETGDDGRARSEECAELRSPSA